MAVADQDITPRWAIYNGDSIEVMSRLPASSIDLSIYSPPFGGLYNYSSNPADLSNCRDYEEFLNHYERFVREISRLTAPGRMTCVHCMDVPTGNTGNDSYIDFPGDIIRMHERHGFRLASPRVCIWKEPLTVRNRTMTKALAHKTIVDDLTDCTVAGADYVLVFRRAGNNRVPVTHGTGLMKFAGDPESMPKELLRYRGWTGDQKQNRYSHWIWRQYASCIWGDIRLDRVLPYREARDTEDEKHVHPLQLDVIDRLIELYSNPGEKVLTPFMGVGSEVYSAVRAGRLAIGAELKPSYYRQAIKNLRAVDSDDIEQEMLFGSEEVEEFA